MIKETNGPEETFAFGKMLGEQAKPGEVICLNGDLGVGKTVFTKGFAEGLGITEPVNSPTFTIVQQQGAPHRLCRQPARRFYQMIIQGKV